MRSGPPRLSIGLPVYNGEDFLAEAIDSILAQTFTDFELIISDNASTDGTRALSEDYAKRDPRVRYHRNDVNIGATQNWYLAHKLSTARYFASVAHDDVYEPEYMRACIDVLDSDPAIVVCHSKTVTIDEHGVLGPTIDISVDTTSSWPHERLEQLLTIDYMCIQLYGVMRTEVLGQTQVFQGYYGCDRNTLAELCLIGKIAEVPRYLFRHRLFAGTLGVIVNSGKSSAEMAAIDPGTDWKRRSVGTVLWRNYFGSVARLVPSPVDRLRCYLVLARLAAPWAVSRVVARMNARTSAAVS